MKLRRRVDDRLDDLHVVDVERAYRVAASVGFFEHFACVYECHIKISESDDNIFCYYTTAEIKNQHDIVTIRAAEYQVAHII